MWRKFAIILIVLALQFNQVIIVAESEEQLPLPLAACPQLLSLYPPHSPASAMPILQWSKVPGAVLYELEILAAPPENPSSLEPSRNQLRSFRDAFTNGYQADLRNLPTGTLYWRVRGLDLHGGPVGVFSDARPLYLNPDLPLPQCPVATLPPQLGLPTPLYPVYHWIPLRGAVQYEVELMDSLPPQLNPAAPSPTRIWHKIAGDFACYDDYPRFGPGTYYYRVRGLDENNQPMSLFSEVVSLPLSRPPIAVATLGDSITHGGGAVSYSPADREYDYQTYLDFPALNLGRSGDTTETMVARFEEDVLPFQPAILLIMGGTNSLRGGIPAAEVIRDLEAVRQKCLSYGIRPVFLTLPPINPAAIAEVFQQETVPDWSEQFFRVNTYIRSLPDHIDIARGFGSEYAPLNKKFAIDGLHLDIDGKRLMAEIINARWASLQR